jgi:opacity protein-like surface antigen
MMRLARVVSCVFVCLFAVAVASEAQPPAVDESRFYAGVTLGATFGHKSSGSVGGEIGGQFSGPIGAFIEFGRLMNVGTEDLDTRALRIANAVGATASASYKVNYFAVGVRVAPDLALRARPYVVLGGGLAQVRAETALAVNGTTVPPENLGVQFGSDLNGTEKKGYFTLGGGVTYPLLTRFFVDGSYRYGRIFPKTDVIENDLGINTNRLQVAVGVKF